MSPNLYTLTPDWGALLQKLEESCGEMTPELQAEAEALMGASKEKLEAAGLAKRNLDIHAALATAQAQVFQQEAARCKAIAEAFASSSDRLGDLMAPLLVITGNIKTPAGTLYTRTNTVYDFALKPGNHFFDLPEGAELGDEFADLGPLWRQKDPELNKSALRKLAEAGRLPDEITAMKADRMTTCLKAPNPKKTDAPATAA